MKLLALLDRDFASAPAQKTAGDPETNTGRTRRIIEKSAGADNCSCAGAKRKNRGTERPY